ncbi:MAG: leucine-rich repeat domain-containing protein [Pseudobutyrivibrio sp.]|nr:leucine-rich repeat domain-containing protein [Pseudobutyrivibrio sp.]
MAEVYWGSTQIKGIKPPGISFIPFYSGGAYRLYVEVPAGTTALENDAFRRCGSLFSITIPSSVTSLGTYCFRDCSSLTSVTIPSSVTSLPNYCFYNCSSLPSITIPSSVTSLGSNCFYGCSNLTKVYFAGNPPSSLSPSAFKNLTLTIYHKADNSNWTSSIKTSTYGGATSVTWSTY